MAPTYYDIYDRSTETECDRLIIVKPFDWYIWAKNGLVYLLNATNENCPITYTPSTLVPASTNLDDASYNFKSVCLYIVFNDVIESYKNNNIGIKVNFQIEEIQAQRNKFTILDALNDLFKNYITMDKENAANVDGDGQISRSKLLEKYTIKSTTNLNNLVKNVKNNLIRLNKKVVL